MKIGIFPGSFNPVHIGHLALANYLLEYQKFDRIWFIITPCSPFKNKIDYMDQNLRLNYLQQSIQGYEKFEVCTVELTMLPPFYTINMLKTLQQTYPLHNFELIIGSDNEVSFHRWNDYQIILKYFKVLVYPRKGYKFIDWNHPNMSLCKDAPKIDISSTFIRNSIVAGKDVRICLSSTIYKKVINNLEKNF